MAGVRFHLDTTDVDDGAKRIKADFDKIGVSAQKAEARVKKLETATRTGGTRMEKATTQTQKARAATTQYGSAVGTVSTQQTRLAQTTKTSRDRLVTFVRSVASTAATLMILDRAFRDIQEAMSVGIEFEQSISEVRGIARATIQEFWSISEAAREAGRTTIWSASESADALRFLARAGFTVKESVAALSDTLNIAQIGELELGRATDIVSDTLRAFNLDVSELTRVVDVFTGTITRSNTDVEMMGDAMKFAAPIAAQLGYSVEQTAAMIGVLSQSGIKSGIAGRGMQMAFVKTAKAAKALGMSVDSNLIDVLRELNVQQVGATEIADIFGVRALKSVLVLKNNIDTYDRFEQTLHNVTGESQRYVEGLQTVEVAIKKFVSIIKDYLIRVFDEYRESLMDFFGNTTEWIRTHEELLINATKVTVAFTKALVQLGVVLLGLKILRKVSTWLVGTQASAAVAISNFKSLSTAASTATGRLAALGTTLKGIWPILAALAAYKAFTITIDIVEAKKKLELIQGKIDMMAGQTVPVLVSILEKNPRFFDEEIGKIKTLIAEQENIIKDAGSQEGTSIFGEVLEAAGIKEGYLAVEKAKEELKKLKAALEKVTLAQEVANGVFEKGMTDLWLLKARDTEEAKARATRIEQTEAMITDISKTAAGKRWKYERDLTEKVIQEYKKYPRAKREVAEDIIDIAVAAGMKEYDAQIKSAEAILKAKKDLIDEFNEEWERSVKGDTKYERDEYVERLNNYFKYLQDMGKITQQEADKRREIIMKHYDDAKKDSEGAYNAIEEFGKKAAQNTQDAFADFLTDTFQGNLTSALDYFKAFMDAMTKAWANALAKMILEEETMQKVGSFGKSLLSKALSSIVGLFGGGVSGPAHVGEGGTTAFGMHGGGVVGRDATFARVVSPTLFNQAPRLHNGLAPDEFPAILQKGETVIPKDSGENATNYNIYIQAVDAKSFADMTKRNPQAIIGPVVTALNENNGGLRASVNKAIGR